MRFRDEKVRIERGRAFAMSILLTGSGRAHEIGLGPNHETQKVTTYEEMSLGAVSSYTHVAARAFLVGLALILCGCAQLHYQETPPGILRGDLIVEWRKPDEFLYKPSSNNPLRFTRSNGDIIQPELMWTDGGSIPRQMWIFRNFSPWGYGPAFIIHDWLFTIQNCQLPGHREYSFDDSAKIMSEVIRTLIDLPEFDYGSTHSMYLMYKAVKSAPAYSSWVEGECIEPPSVFEAGVSKPDKVYTISFD